MNVSRYFRFLERQEAKQKPCPGVWVFNAVVWGVIGVAMLVFFLTSHVGGHKDWGLLILPVGAAIIVPVSVLRCKRDLRRQTSWVNST